MIKAVDVGYGAVKGVSAGREIEYLSAVGNYRPVRFTSNMEPQDIKDRLCIKFEGKSYFIGDIAYKQSTPRVTMSKDRFISQEGLALMMSALLMLSNGQSETIKLVAGLPVNEYAAMKEKYADNLKGTHYCQLLDIDGRENDFYRFDIETVKVLPQPVGTIFDSVLDHCGQLTNKQLAGGRLAVLDIGKHTVDLAVTDSLQFVDKSSISFNDIGLFDAFKDLSIALKAEGYDIPPDNIEPYIKATRNIDVLPALREEAFASQAEKIVSRIINTWPDLWSFDKVIITGGGALPLGEYIADAIDCPRTEICAQPTLTNCRGFYKYGQRAWG